MRTIRKFSLTLAATSILLLLAIALTSVGASIYSKQSAPSKPRAQAAAARTMKTYTMYSGLWRTDGGFVSTIRVKNILVVAPMEATPVLFMADGTPYTLPSIHVPVSGVVTVNVNDALAAAPQSVAGHVSQFGSVSLIWSYFSPGHLSAQVAAIDASRSLSYTFPFAEPMGASMQQTLEGLWWKHDPNVSGWLALSNVTDAATQATVQLVGPGNAVQPAKTVALSPHTAQMFHLDDFASNPSPLAKDAGGIRVTYTGQLGSVQASGGLENPSEGYSANMPFRDDDMSSAPATTMTYASAGIMVGKPDPMMMPGFPKDTTFAPYLVLRNTTEKPLDVSAQLNYMMSMPTSATSKKTAAPATRSLTTEHLAPGQAKQVNMQAAITSAGLDNFNGSVNLSVAFTGKAGDLLMASGSVDQTGTYVFEVEPQGVGSSRSKYSNYWGVTNGNDTMYSLWNPTDTPQDIAATFYYGDGSGKYILPIHLEPQASAMIDMAMLIMEKKPDANGNLIPSSIQEGSAEFSSAKDRREMITLVIAGGLYNVATATCGGTCFQCCGVTVTHSPANPQVYPTPFSCLPGDTVALSGSAEDCSGAYYSPDTNGWTSDNTSVATVDGSGNVTCKAAGSVNINATWSNMVATTSQVCGAPSCPTFNPGSAAPAQGTVKVPTSLSVVLGVLASSGQCSSSEYGAQADITYQVRDQNGAQIQASGMQPQEIITNFFINGVHQPDPAPNWANLGAPSDSTGRFHDTPLGVCAGFAVTETATQQISVVYKNTRYPASGALKTNSLRFTGLTVGHGRICNGTDSNCTGADFDVSR